MIQAFFVSTFSVAVQNKKKTENAFSKSEFDATYVFGHCIG